MMHPEDVDSTLRIAPLLPLEDRTTGAILGEIGTLQVRLVQSAGALEAAQKLRHLVFRETNPAQALKAHTKTDIDTDAYDAICDHLIVTDTDPVTGDILVVGTCRMLMDSVADAHHGFYSAQEFDIPRLRRAHSGKRLLELGRSCILASHRTKRSAELLWQGIWAYVVRHRIDLMFGCASFEGTNPDAHAEALSFLRSHYAAHEGTGTSALPHLHQSMDRIPPDAIDLRRAFRGLPPLIKGYLRLGARIGDGAVIDPDFGTIDILIILPVEGLDPRYVAYYGADASRYAPRNDAPSVGRE
jgi:L-ornithine Nalpha-acyltransferase